jgi:hypothetical protein
LRSSASTGKILWQPNLGIGFGAPPIAYAVNGTEYIAVADGGNAISAGDSVPLGGTLVVFKLGGKPQLDHRHDQQGVYADRFRCGSRGQVLPGRAD